MIKIKKDYVFSTEGVMTESCEFTLSDEIVNRIKKGKEILSDNNSIIDKVGFNVMLDIKQFNSTLDDVECIEEVEFSDTDYFRTDTEVINIYRYGIYLRCYGKWDSSQYIEVEIE